MRPLVGLAALTFSALYLVSDAVEAIQSGFSTGQLWLTLVAEAAIPVFVIGLYLAQRPWIGRLGLISAAAYAYAYVYFTGTVIYALANATPDYATLSDALQPWMTIHGAIMVFAGLGFGLAVLRANVLPNWTAVALMAGVVLVALSQTLPEGVQFVAAAVRALGFAGMGAALLRSGSLRWGASDEEVAMTLPGDGLIADVDLTATRAVTVDADAEAVWPWLAQLGQGRGGFYSYDRLENLFGCDIHSADRIVPEWQHLAFGNEVRLHPEVTMTVALVEPGRSLVLRGGVPIAGRPAPYDFTWAFTVLGDASGATRLVVRERYAYRRPWAALIVEPVELVSFVMSRRMLRGIAERAEARSRLRPQRER